jgi:hypothetical protein
VVEIERIVDVLYTGRPVQASDNTSIGREGARVILSDMSTLSEHQRIRLSRSEAWGS